MTKQQKILYIVFGNTNRHKI